jgi:hypothetical protein
MSELVKGENVTVFKYESSINVWVPYACARSCSFSIETDTIETSITGSGKYRTFVPRSNASTGSLEGLTQLEKVNNLSIADLIQLQVNHEILLMRWEDISDNGDVFTKELEMFITNTTQTASFDNVATFSVSLQGTGPITLVYTPTPIIQGIMYRKEFILPANEDSIVLSELNGVSIDNVISIILDNSDASIIIGSGTPIGQEVKYNSSGATITFPFATDIDLNGYVSYQIIYEAS